MELLTENANLSRKIALLEQDSSSSETTNHQHANEDNPWKKELSIAEQKISDLQQVLQNMYLLTIFFCLFFVAIQNVFTIESIRKTFQT